MFVQEKNIIGHLFERRAYYLSVSYDYGLILYRCALSVTYCVRACQIKNQFNKSSIDLFNKLIQLIYL